MTNHIDDDSAYFRHRHEEEVKESLERLERMRIEASISTSPERLAYLAVFGDLPVRLEVARNPLTPLDTLDYLDTIENTELNNLVWTNLSSRFGTPQDKVRETPSSIR